jgi:hypothetical protein
MDYIADKIGSSTPPRPDNPASSTLSSSPEQQKQNDYSTPTRETATPSPVRSAEEIIEGSIRTPAGRRSARLMRRKKD